MFSKSSRIILTPWETRGEDYFADLVDAFIDGRLPCEEFLNIVVPPEDTGKGAGEPSGSGGADGKAAGEPSGSGGADGKDGTSDAPKGHNSGGLLCVRLGVWHCVWGRGGGVVPAARA